MGRSETLSLRDWLDAAESNSGLLHAIDAEVALGALAQGSSLDCNIASLQGRSVLIATRDQLTTALALIELDGVARRLTLLPPDLPHAQLAPDHCPRRDRCGGGRRAGGSRSRT
jgi:hypothetical protein